MNSSMLQMLGPHGTNPWRTTSSEIMYKGPWNSVRRDEVIRPDGKPGQYYVFERENGNHLIILNEKDEILLVGQWRYPTGNWSWEPPGGNRKVGESIFDAARRELLEETGLSAALWEHLADADLLNGTMSARVEVVLGTTLTKVAEPRALEDGIEASIWVPATLIPELVRDGHVTNGPALVALLFFMLKRGVFA